MSWGLLFSLKELEKLLKDAKAGKTVKEDDIPPPVFVKGAVSSPSEPTQVQVSHDNTEKASELVEKPVMKGIQVPIYCAGSMWISH